ncbi:hypothetical protein AVEN_177402-1 [Araneus ventricosus]|uniref:Uncharacterized protein n=1 Tax=Araneus ventricosus TaxID=182803 RepID=A0A4Y2RKM6_ARAVE|nr:hypothetical protein AVEN_76748-1 [Araneus ventricosus]GBN75809.1 hypothetical protein AVEN_177402-1 [Araneus ventricosus]
MEAGQEKLEQVRSGQQEMKSRIEDKMEVGQEILEQVRSGQQEMKSRIEDKMEAGQERLAQVRSGQQEMKSEIRAHIESQVEEMLTDALEKQMRKSNGGVRKKVQEKIGKLERRTNELEER